MLDLPPLVIYIYTYTHVRTRASLVGIFSESLCASEPSNRETSTGAVSTDSYDGRTPTRIPLFSVPFAFSSLPFFASACLFLFRDTCQCQVYIGWGLFVPSLKAPTIANAMCWTFRPARSRDGKIWKSKLRKNTEPTREYHTGCGMRDPESGACTLLSLYLLLTRRFYFRANFFATPPCANLQFVGLHGCRLIPE